MRLTRHAKNKARSLKATLADIEGLIRYPIHVDADPEGRPRYEGWIRGVKVRIVAALDEPDLVVTIHERRKDAS